MNRLLGVLTLGLLVAGTAVADIAPPKGQKRVALDTKITTETEYGSYAFFLVSGGDKVEPVKLDPKTPLVIAGAGRGGRYRLVELVATPSDAAKKYGSQKDFHAALLRNQVEGMVRAKTGFGTLATIKDTDTRKSVVEEYKLEKITDKDGIVVTAVKSAPPKGGSTPPPKGGEESDEPTDAAAYAPKSGLLVAGLAASAAVALTGLWLAGRRRRDAA